LHKLSPIGSSTFGSAAPIDLLHQDWWSSISHRLANVEKRDREQAGRDCSSNKVSSPNDPSRQPHRVLCKTFKFRRRTESRNQSLGQQPGRRASNAATGLGRC
jgi:hypothetical protein